MQPGSYNNIPLLFVVSDVAGASLSMNRVKAMMNIL
jgi:hypothetical protein